MLKLGGDAAIVMSILPHVVVCEGELKSHTNNADAEICIEHDIFTCEHALVLRH